MRRLTTQKARERCDERKLPGNSGALGRSSWLDPYSCYVYVRSSLCCLFGWEQLFHKRYDDPGQPPKLWDTNTPPTRNPQLPNPTHPSEIKRTAYIASGGVLLRPSLHLAEAEGPLTAPATGFACLLFACWDMASSPRAQSGGCEHNPAHPL